MGADIAAAFPAAREVYAAADELLGFSLSTLCWEGPEADLNDTFNTQPALYVTSIAILRALETELGPVTPAYVAGHSLGELTALTAANALPFEDGLRLVRERGRLMKQAGIENPGAMAALLGLSTESVNDVCQRAREETGQQLVLANDNCPGQIVISGHEAALERGMELATEAGAKRAVKLAVSIASHSPLMSSIADQFAQSVATSTLQAPAIPVIGNVTAAVLPDIAAIQQELTAQLTSSVRWTETMAALQSAGITRYVEIGSKDVLVGLVKRFDRSSERIALNTADGLQRFVQQA